MGTNYYARVIPSKERKDILKEAIDKDDYMTINKLYDDMYGDVQVDHVNGKLSYGTVHLGKRSSGWKFLWNPNVYRQYNTKGEFVDGRYEYKRLPPSPLYVYGGLDRKSIKQFINRDDIVIYNEYWEKQDKDDFFIMAIGWNAEDGFDGASYRKKNNGHQYGVDIRLMDNYMYFLEEIGYKINEPYTDFYSDGLRFSTTIYFS